jgi:hypothetical protein
MNLSALLLSTIALLLAILYLLSHCKISRGVMALIRGVQLAMSIAGFLLMLMWL